MTSADKKPMLLASFITDEKTLDRLIPLGFTVFQSDTDHLSTDEVSPGVWDFSVYDRKYAAVRARNCKWMILTHFAWPPYWYRKNEVYTRLECLEHCQSVEAFSIWDPKAYEYLERGYAAWKEHFKDDEDDFFGFYVGVHGDYGEAVFPAAYRMKYDQKQDWLEHFEDLHNHYGWWCGDPLAQKDFAGKMLGKYGGYGAMNRAWNADFCEGKPAALPIFGLANRRYWLDFVRWYFDSMVEYARAHMKALSRNFPDLVRLLPMGAEDEDLRIGQDYTALTKMCSEEGAQVRSTHGGFFPFDINSVSQLTRLGSACKFYKVPFWTEPQSGMPAYGQVGRIFECLCNGAVAFWDWPRNVEDPEGAAVIEKYRHLLVVDMPLVEAAIFYPQTWHYMQRVSANFPKQYRRLGARAREAVHMDVLDELMIADGALDNYRFLIHFEGDIIESDTLEKIARWLKNGGVWFVYLKNPIETVEGDASVCGRLFGFTEPVTGLYSVGDGFVYVLKDEGDDDSAMAALRGVLYKNSPNGTHCRSIDTGTPGVYGLLYPDGRVLLYNMNRDGPRTVRLKESEYTIGPAAILECGAEERSR